LLNKILPSAYIETYENAVDGITEPATGQRKQ